MMNIFFGKLDRRDFFVKYIVSMTIGVAFAFLLLKLEANFPLVLNNYKYSYSTLSLVIVALAVQVYLISLYIRRLRDAKLSPWITLVAIIKPLDFLLFIVLLFIPSKQK